MFLTNEEFINLTDFVKVNYGIDLKNKKSFVEIRTHRLIEEHGAKNFTDYFNDICMDVTGLQITAFINALTVNHTLFNRESGHFEYMTKTILPYLYEKNGSRKDIRIWSAGCSTGEEPYTLAMTIADFLSMRSAGWDTKILATDISTFALQKAAEGCYPYVNIENLPPHWINRYFIKDINDVDTIHIHPSIKNEVIFRKLNLIGEQTKFKKNFDVIFCRNVMIYFDEPTKNALINKYYDSLNDGGYLFIGMTENIDKGASNFNYIMPSVYRKDAV